MLVVLSMANVEFVGGVGAGVLLKVFNHGDLLSSTVWSQAIQVDTVVFSHR